MFASVPVPTPSVVVSSVRDGFSYIFDPAYSQRLSGVISSAEYRASIDRINTASRSQGAFCANLISAALIIGGFVCFLMTGVTMSHGGGGFPITVILGMVIFLCGGLVLVISRRGIAKGILQRMTAAIAAENDYYARASRACTWRLHAQPTTLISSRGTWRTIYDYQIEIELNAPAQVIVPVANYPYPAENMNAPLLPPSYQQSSQPAYVPSQQYQPPVTYNTYGTVAQQQQPQAYVPVTNPELALCVQCQHKLKQDEKFCSQCGHRVNATL